MSKSSRRTDRIRRPREVAEVKRSKLRIIGGRFGGRQIDYSGDPITRPMKDDTREAVFNLVGGWVPGRAAFDLFAGTGAMGLEAISRGASQAFLIERHFPTVRIMRHNLHNLDPDLPVQIESSDTFFWARQFLKSPEQWPTEPWVVFCCPPYDLYVQQEAKVLELVRSLFEAAPSESLFVVESDARFDPQKLPQPHLWNTRKYSPAQISVYRESVGENAYQAEPTGD